MKLITGLFRFARKRVQTKDNDMGMFREKLTELVDKKDSLSDEDVTTRVEELKSLSADLPDEEGKEKLNRFLEDFKSVKEQDSATAKEAASMVSDLFEKLDTEAMKDVPVTEETSEEETKEEIGDEEPPTVGEYAKENVKEDIEHITETKDGDEEEVAEEAVEETEAPDTKDSDNADYTLEKIYQFIKKRMAEDCADSAEEVEEAEEEETEEEQEDEEEVVTDHAPRIPVTFGNHAAEGSLADMFNKIKEGGR